MRPLKTRLRHRVVDGLAVLGQRYSSSAPSQRVLAELYGKQATEPLDGPLWQYGFSNLSQTDEDGILLYLFSVLGAPTRTAIEMCCGEAIESNTANLILNHGWNALLVDGDPDNVKRAKRFFANTRMTYVYPPKVVQAWITRDSINSLIESNGFGGEIDLLSLDLDGVDYWLWKAITVANPRVVVVEYQDILGPDRALTVPYADDFRADAYSETNNMPNFAGASLAAFVRLARQKGYRLVGVNRLGYNAFFVRNDLGAGILPELPIEEAFKHPKNVEGMRERYPLVADLPWVDVSEDA